MAEQGLIDQVKANIPEDAAERLHTVYEDIEPMEILGVMENYTRLRNQSIRGEHDVS